MNDNPTPQEIEAFEKANPGLAAPKEISQWWLRSGLIALGVWAGVFWVWLRRNVFNRPIVLLLLVCVSANPQQFSGPIPRSLTGGSTPAGCVGPLLDTTNLVGAWMWQEGSGTTSADLSGNGNTATLTTAGGYPQWTSGNFLGALTYNNADTAFADCGTGSSLNPVAITVEAWVNFSAFTPAYSAVVSKIGGAGELNQLLVKSSGKLAVYCGENTGTQDYDGTGTITLTAGTWYFLTFTFSAAEGLVGYVNGSVDASVGASAEDLASNTGHTEIGNDSGTAGRNPNATIGSVFIYNVAKSAAAIAYDYTVTCP